MSCLSSPPCAGIDYLIEPLRSTIQAKVKANAVKQEHEKQEELKRSSHKVMAAECQFVKVCPPLPPQSVRRVALVAFNSAAHNKPVLIADLLDSLLHDMSSLFSCCIVDLTHTHTNKTY